MTSPKMMTVNTSSRNYPIYFTTGFDFLTEAISSLEKTYSKFVIITDDHVNPLYTQQIIDELANFEREVIVSSFIPGEHYKTLKTIESFYQDLIEHGSDRGTLIIALGGGVAGDMAGYTAATYMRGVDFIQIPTSLLAQVDSSIGGKTGVDFNGYKNIVGAFYQPMLVYINVNTLQTLPRREFMSGMAEVIKHALIKDSKYYDFLSENVEQIKALDTEVLIEMIYQSCAIKKSVVDEDEKEQGVRALLNFGHTFGHSIERLKNFEYLHGECVAIGMHGALELSKQLGLISSDEVNKGLALIKAYELPIYASNLEHDLLYQEMFYDKKTSHNRIVFALLSALGESFLSKEKIDQHTINQVMDVIIN